MATSAALIRQLEAVHTAFHVGAVERLYPGLGEGERERAVGRERQRDSAYLANMKARIKAGMAAARSERGLSSEERGLRMAELAATELRYMRQHIAAASQRLQSEADISRLKARGEHGAYWLLNPRYTHCETCLRMGERWWPWRVLDRVSPAITHPGCHCVLISSTEAERSGHQVIAGRHTPSVAQLDLNEAARELAMRLIREGEREHRNGHSPTGTSLDTPLDTPEPHVADSSPIEPNKVDIPKDKKAARNAKIAEMWAQQRMSQSAIGRVVGLSQPRVRAILIQRFGEEALRVRGRSGARHDLVSA